MLRGLLFYLKYFVGVVFSYFFKLSAKKAASVNANNKALFKKRRQINYIFSVFMLIKQHNFIAIYISKIRVLGALFCITCRKGNINMACF